ncbi:MAG: class I tRNA ligase family protein, partial [Ruminococcus callidus]
IYYPSGNPHIGHCYTTVACDSIARYRRMQGYDVIFLTGTDEHGLKIEQKAAAKGITPKEYVDEIVKTFKALWEKMHVSYDRYIRTTDDYHIETVQKIFKRLYDLGYIYKGEYKGKYCTPCESFWTESQLDENGCCPECHREVVEAKEEAYFMKMAPFAERIKKLLLETDYLQPKTRAVELVNNFIKPGLEDLCVSRTSFTWGIPVTFDPKHGLCRVDAHPTAISVHWAMKQRLPRFRQVLAGRCAHGCQRHHAVPCHYPPAMLMALDLPLPCIWQFTVDHFQRQKMSSRPVDPFPGGLLRSRCNGLPYPAGNGSGADSSFSNDRDQPHQPDLANGLAIWFRTVAMVDKYFGGTCRPNASPANLTRNSSPQPPV